MTSLIEPAQLPEELEDGIKSLDDALGDIEASLKPLMEDGIAVLQVGFRGKGHVGWRESWGVLLMD